MEPHASLAHSFVLGGASKPIRARGSAPVLSHDKYDDYVLSDENTLSGFEDKLKACARLGESHGVCKAHGRLEWFDRVDVDSHLCL